MSGITPLLDTLLHQVLGKRVDTAPPRELTEPVRPVDPGEGPRALHSDSRLEGRRPATAPLQGASTHAQRGDGQLLRGDTPQAPASFQTHFSPSARTIADLLLRFPAPPSVLSAKAPLMNAGETPGASTLADRLQSSVRDSGLFYESHLARWYRGEMSRQQLGNEPQMLRTQRFAPAVSTTSGAPMQAANAAVAASNAQSQVSAGQMQSGQCLAKYSLAKCSLDKHSLDRCSLANRCLGRQLPWPIPMPLPNPCIPRRLAASVPAGRPPRLRPLSRVT
ncbi:hypothetical protein EKK97_13445 [Billgrantia tianxiuensis]|uniref:Uncharacterized protein n=1 Tax=Billgrantia tianxiuensis TaxID=2497861 RepID=A0A6I6SPI2_9GAMM|nr:hypothetical protein [Halomonas tianxiuensis]QHC50384.1 hypothetical protein EKK97_13445 [Halomonas tianxiuensis]